MIKHLSDLDELDQRRLDEFLACASVLSAWDMANRKTEEAEHDDHHLAPGALVLSAGGVQGVGSSTTLSGSTVTPP